jgi:glycosyltransferase involved in cell wall biosynthesis
MNIAIDTLAAKSYQHGTGVYVFNLVNRLIKIGSEHNFLLFLTQQNADYFVNSKNTKRIFVTSNRLLRIPWENLALPFTLPKQGVSVFWGPTNFLPTIKLCKYVATIHDMTALAFPEYLPTARRFHYRNSIINSCRFADRIITISEQLKKEIMQYLKVPDKKISVIYNGLDELFTKQLKIEQNVIKPISPQLKEKYSLPDSYIFTLSVLEPKKNVSNLVRAYAQLKTKYQKNNLPKLVIGGSKEYGWRNREFFQTVEESKLQDKVIFSGMIDHNDLPAIYQAASLFVLPSIHEGFGLPVIEAMACGTPVVTSNTSCLPEIAGNAAILANPYEPKDIAQAIEQGLYNKDLRREMIQKGRINVLRFSWDIAAEKILKVFEEVHRASKMKK